MCMSSIIYDMFGKMPDSWFNQGHINLFKQMIAEASIFDIDAGQPDCEDAEKAKVLDRIESLEQHLKEKEE